MTIPGNRFLTRKLTYMLQMSTKAAKMLTLLKEMSTK